MLNRPAFRAALFSFTLAAASHAQSITPAFTYQGRLESSAGPANGTYDFQFRLWDSATLGVQQGATLCADNVSVVDGRFTVSLDFGAQYSGTQRFLQISVRADTGLNCSNAAGFIPLAPRQALTAAPFASYATSAASAAAANNASLLGGQGSSFYTNAANLSAGTLPDARLATTVARTNVSQTISGMNTFTNPANSFAGSGAGLTSLNASALTTGAIADGLLSANIPRLSQANTFTHPSNSFTGNGAGLTSLNASAITTGTLSDALLSSNIPRLNQPNAFSSSQSISASSNSLLSLNGTAAGGTWLNMSNSSAGGRSWSLSSAGSASTDGTGKFIVRDNTAGVTRIAIDTSGNVGVGTVTPSYRLDVLTTSGFPLAARSSSLGGSWLALDDTPGGGREWNFIATGPNNGEGAGKLIFRDGSANAVRMTLDTSGNVGIGTVFPAAKLDVNGSINATNMPGVTYNVWSRDTRNTGSAIWLNGGESRNVDQLTVNSPASGYLLIMATLDGEVNSDPYRSPSEGLLLFKLDETTPGNAHTILETTLGTNASGIGGVYSMNRGVLTLHWCMPVSAGSRTFQTSVWNHSNNIGRYWSTTLIVQYIPRGI